MLFTCKQPLGLPAGSIRGFAAVSLIITAVYCTVFHVVVDDRMWDLIIAFSSLYVGSRLEFDKRIPRPPLPPVPNPNPNPAPTEDTDCSYIGWLKFKWRIFDIHQPLYLPNGSIRAILVLTLVFTAVYCSLHGIELTSKMWDLVLGFSSLYIGSRLNFSKPDEPS